MMVENNETLPSDMSDSDSYECVPSSENIKKSKKNEAIGGEKEKFVEVKKSNKRKQVFERKNIRNIIDEEGFCQDAKDAQKAEAERLKRVQEKEQNLRLLSLLSEDLRQNLSNHNPALSQLFKLAPSTLPPASAMIMGGFKRSYMPNKLYRPVADDVINLDDSEDEKEERMELSNKQPLMAAKSFEVIEISDGEDDDDNVDDAVDQEQLDVSNFNPDTFGRILINVAHPEDEEDYFLSEKITASIKPHQVSGIRFLYNNLVESKRQFQESDGFGCILAHSMGLGKTLQIIGFLDILFRCVKAKSALVIVPINTYQNWQAEFEFWLPKKLEQTKTDNSNNNNIIDRSFNVFLIKENHKSIESRHAVLKQWMETGGVLLIGYEMFRLLVTYRQNKSGKPANSKSKSKQQQASVVGTAKVANKKSICIDIELEEKRDSIYQDFLRALIDPGPEVVICDEGHRIKNSEASISKALKAIRTQRRVVMTGYPLQNNLTEYWCMVDFVRPSYLGTKHEFNNMFQRPIENGQCVDSTVADRKLMQGRAHVLHELLEGFVQRRSHAVLKASLPPKWEYVILIKMSYVQRKLYSSFMDQLINSMLYSWIQNNTLKTYAMCCKIWNHPDILYKAYKEQKATELDPDFDFDIEEELSSTGGRSIAVRSKSSAKSKDSSKRSLSSTHSTLQDVDNDSNSQTDTDTVKDFSTKPPAGIRNGESKAKFDPTEVAAHQIPANYMSFSEYLESVANRDDTVTTNPFSWISDDVWTLNKDVYKTECRENGGKIVIFLSLLEECLQFGDKMLVFSQSLSTLDLIEVFLKQSSLADGTSWIKNKTYFRLDGSTSSTERERMIVNFNESDSEAHLFLLSTRAGCLGINLIGANRVVVFDASWNPCHDCQAVCRVYRYGQRKPCFIYRLVTDNTMEKKIYDRQVTKQGISDRVVDESNPGQQFTRSQVQGLIDYQDKDIPSLNEDQKQIIRDRCSQEDPILGRILERNAKWVTTVPFTHESLLIDQKDYRLTRREKRKAKERYELDKRQSLYYQRNSYSDCYIKTSVTVNEPNFPVRQPSIAYRSSIIPTMNAVPQLPSLTVNHNHYKINRGFVRPPQTFRPSSALIREIEQARLRCGFSKDTSQFSIPLSDDDDDNVGVDPAKKMKFTDQTATAPHIPPSLPPKISYPSSTVNTSITDNQTNGIARNPSKLEQNSDVKGIKVIKVTASVEFNLPNSQGTLMSQAGNQQPNNISKVGGKVSVGDPLEIIYTPKGKFLRVARSGELFAIKDNSKDDRGNPVMSFGADGTEDNSIIDNNNPVLSSYSSPQSDSISRPPMICCNCKPPGLSIPSVPGCACMCHRFVESNPSSIVYECPVPIYSTTQTSSPQQQSFSKIIQQQSPQHFNSGVTHQQTNNFIQIPSLQQEFVPFSNFGSVQQQSTAISTTSALQGNSMPIFTGLEFTNDQQPNI